MPRRSQQRLQDRAHECLKDLIRLGRFVPAIGSMLKAGGLADEYDRKRELLFLSAIFGHLAMVKWMLIEDPKPLSLLSVDAQNRTVLHFAVGARQHSVAAWLLKSTDGLKAGEIEAVLCTKTSIRGSSAAPNEDFNSAVRSSGATPLLLAVRARDAQMVSLLIRSQYTWAYSEKLTAVYRDARAEADQAMCRSLDAAYREIAVETSWTMFEDKDFPRLRAKIQHSPRWQHRVDLPWSKKEHHKLLQALRRAAMHGNLEVVQWLVDDWGVSVERSDLYCWEWLPSVFTSTALGKAAFDRIVDSRVERPNNGEDSRDPWYRNHVQLVLMSRWDGCSALSIFIRTQLSTSEGHCDGSFELEREWKKLLSTLDEDHIHERCQVMDFFIDKFGAIALPRLHFLLETDRRCILEWLVEKHYLDPRIFLNGQHAQVQKSHTQLGSGKGKKIRTGKGRGESSVSVVEEDGREVHDVCAICLRPKHNAISLMCLHSFCQMCLHQYFKTEGREVHAHCPLCRCEITLHCMQPGNRMIEGLLEQLPNRLPWIEHHVFDNFTVGEMLLVVAVGMGSVRIVEWLISGGIVSNPNHLRISGGRNLMHVAATEGKYIVAKWLGANGLLDLALKPDDRGLNAVQESLRNANMSMVHYFETQNLIVVEEVLKFAPQSHPEIQKLTEDYVLHKVLSRDLPQSLSAGATLDCIKDLINSFDVVRSAFCNEELQDLLRGFMQDLVRKDRVDVLRWLYSSEHSCHLSRAVDDKHGRSWLAPAGQCSDRISVLFVEVDEAKRLKRDCWELRDSFRDLFAKGASVEELESILACIAVKVAQVGPDFKDNFQYCTLRLEHIMMHGHTPLEYAVEVNHVHLVKWLLEDKWHGDYEESLNALYLALMLSNLDVVQYLVCWLREQSLDVNVAPAPRASSEMKDREPAFLNALSILAVTHLMKDEDAKERAWAVFRWLVVQPGIDVNALSKSQSEKHALQIVGRFSAFGFPESFWFEVLQLLVANGVDYPPHASSLIQELAKAGYMTIVRWLALELCVDIQGLVVGSSFETYKWKSLPDGDALGSTFESIQKEQKKHFRSTGVSFAQVPKLCASCAGCVQERRHCCPCMSARYCSEVCQRDHWRTHKLTCTFSKSNRNKP